MTELTIKTAGVDVSKEKLKIYGVTRVDMEATGGYEAKVASFLRKAGFAVVILNPRQVHGYRKMMMQTAKTDEIDARLIAAVAELIDVKDHDPCSLTGHCCSGLFFILYERRTLFV